MKLRVCYVHKKHFKKCFNCKITFNFYKRPHQVVLISIPINLATEKLGKLTRVTALMRNMTRF